MDWNIVIQAVIISAITAGVTTYINVLAMKAAIETLKEEVKELRITVRALELVAAELRGRQGAPS